MYLKMRYIIFYNTAKPNPAMFISLSLKLTVISALVLLAKITKHLDSFYLLIPKMSLCGAKNSVFPFFNNTDE